MKNIIVIWYLINAYFVSGSCLPEYNVFVLRGESESFAQHKSCLGRIDNFLQDRKNISLSVFKSSKDSISSIQAKGGVWIGDCAQNVVFTIFRLLQTFCDKSNSKLVEGVSVFKQGSDNCDITDSSFISFRPNSAVLKTWLQRSDILDQNQVLSFSPTCTQVKLWARFANKTWLAQSPGALNVKHIEKDFHRSSNLNPLLRNVIKWNSIPQPPIHHWCSLNLCPYSLKIIDSDTTIKHSRILVGNQSRLTLIAEPPLKNSDYLLRVTTIIEARNHQLSSSNWEPFRADKTISVKINFESVKENGIVYVVIEVSDKITQEILAATSSRFIKLHMKNDYGSTFRPEKLYPIIAFHDDNTIENIEKQAETFRKTAPRLILVVPTCIHSLQLYSPNLWNEIICLDHHQIINISRFYLLSSQKQLWPVNVHAKQTWNFMTHFYHCPSFIFNQLEDIALLIFYSIK